MSEALSWLDMNCGALHSGGTGDLLRRRRTIARVMLAAAAVVVLLLACSPEGQGPAETPRHRGNTKYGVEVQTGPMDGILLKDYRPASSLAVTRTEIHKARFPAIDVHAHTSMNKIRTRGIWEIE